jgi:hypothetical protein
VKRLLLAAGLALLVASPAAAQFTRYDALHRCESFAAVDFKRRNPAFRRFTIDRASIRVDRFAGQVGNQYVSAVYTGRALYDGGAGLRLVRFVCLDGGLLKGPVFVYALPD